MLQDSYDPATAQFLAIDVRDIDAHAAYCEGRDLPLIQETRDQPVWEDWKATWRDVMIVDASGTIVDVYNLTEHDLDDPANLAEFAARVDAVIAD